MNRRQQSGQILVVFVAGALAFIALAALAIDVSLVYSLQQMERSTADAAALAGAQDLKQKGSRRVTAVEYANARSHALQNLASKLGATSAPSCSTAADIADCPIPGTPYLVSIKTPSPSAVNVDPNRAIQVTVRQPSVPLTFARLFGQNNWNVAMTSVAGLGFGKSYAIETLRPPSQVGNTYDVKDITLDGGTVVNVLQGDVGSNSNMVYAGTGTVMNLDSGFGMYYFDPYNGPMWNGSPAPPAQIVKKLPKLIPDPGYRYPAMTGSLGTAPTWDDARASQYADLPAVERADADPTCEAERQKVISNGAYAFMAATPAAKVFCYNPGVYLSGSGAKNARITVGSDEVALLKPGVYYLRSGLDVSGRLIGGYEAGQPGVSVMFDEVGPGNCSGCIFSGNNALTIALNAGTKFPPGTSGTAATAARDWDDKSVDTGSLGPTPPILITLSVRKDPGCYVPTSPPLVEPTTCDATRNKTINIAGVGRLALEGVQYAPTDNIEISGNSSADGQVGQIVAWTVKWSGGIRINQEGPSTTSAGIVHLDAACSGGSAPCTP